jgi:hypothetical protein
MKTEFNSIFAAISAFKKIAEKTEKGISKNLKTTICDGYIYLFCSSENNEICVELMQTGDSEFCFGFIRSFEF